MADAQTPQKTYLQFTSAVSDFSESAHQKITARSEFFKKSALKILGRPSHVARKRFSLGIVGTRRPSPYGLSFIRELVRQLYGHDLQILSGGAMGIDAFAHSCALEAGLPTQAWLVGPLLRPSPRSNWSLFQKILASEKSFLVVPECLEPAKDKIPQKYQWLERNWWLAAACDALVVAEADVKSGTYATVKAANELGVPVFLLPGSIFNQKSCGINAMISEGCGTVITSVEFLVKTLIERSGGQAYNEKVSPRAEQGA